MTAGSRLVRIGKVSSINYSAGLIAVTYGQLDGATTVALPAFAFCDEYKMPRVGDNVLVLHLSDGQTYGFVLGPYWNDAHRCPQAGEGVWHKEIGPQFGQAFMHYDSSGNLTIKVPGAVKIQAADLTVNGISVLDHLEGGA